MHISYIRIMTVCDDVCGMVVTIITGNEHLAHWVIQTAKKPVER